MDPLKTAWNFLPHAQIQAWKRDGFWADCLISDRLDQHARDTPEQIAFVDSRQAISYSQLQELTWRIAVGLQDRGLKRGDVVAIQLPNWIEFPSLYVALVRLGAVASLIPPMCRENEVAMMLKLSNAKWYVCADSFRGFNFEAMAQSLQEQSAFKALKVLCVSHEMGVESSWERALNAVTLTPQAIQGLRISQPSPDDLTEIVFTSGTTGEPKGVMHTHNTVMAPQIAMARSLDIGMGSVLHMASTLAHQTGFLNGIQLTLQIGACTVLQDVWNTSDFFKLVEKYHIEVSSGSSTYLLDMVRSNELTVYDLSSFRIFRAGGGPIPIAVVNESEEKIKNLTVLRGWGQTENGVVTLSRLSDRAEVRASLDGVAQAGMQIRVVGDDGMELPNDQEGLLQARGPFMCIGYINHPNLLNESIQDGWFNTGDLASQNKDGYLKITGRLKDVIIRGGEKIPVSYVENILFEDERILEVALVGQPDERLGERVCAFVLCRPNQILTLAEMKAYLMNKGVAKPYWPEFLEIVESFPRTSNGKIQKAKLKNSFQPN